MHPINRSRQTPVPCNKSKSIYQRQGTASTLRMHTPPLSRPRFYPNGGPSTDDVNGGPSTALVNRPQPSQKFNVKQRHQHPVTNSASSKINGPQKPSTIHKIRHVRPMQQVHGFNSQTKQSQNENPSHTNTNNSEEIKFISSQFISFDTKTTQQQSSSDMSNSAARTETCNDGFANITSSVELNALAKKLGRWIVYVYDTVPLPSEKSHLRHQKFSKYNTANQGTTTSCKTGMSNIASKTEMFELYLLVGCQMYTGIGDTLQAAKHDAASKALEVLKPSVSSSSDGSKDTNIKINDDNNNSSIAIIKSPISLVHETALKRNLPVTFEVKSEQGAPHIKTFVTVCKVGDIITTGEGSTKKLAKIHASENMLEELKKLPPLPSSSFCNKNDNLSNSENNEMSESNKIINEISILLEITQASKKIKPIYTLIEEKRLPKNPEFVMEVSAFGKTARGSGPNKKIAKKLAAKNLLILMGTDGDVCPNEKNESESMKNDVELNKKQETATALTRQPETTPAGTSSKDLNQDIKLLTRNFQNINKNSIRSKKNDNKTKKSNATSTNQNNDDNNNSRNYYYKIRGCKQDARPKYKLAYLAEKFGFELNFSYYEKGSKYLTTLALLTDPPQICRAYGDDIDSSESKAAMTAICILNDLGLHD